jgi:UDP-2-acetamido-3-amino-2,3-dideoxy-glucuronate N-acetyltransferase
MMPALSSLRPSNLAPNLLIGSDVTLGEGVEIGPNVVIHDGVTVEAGVRIEHGVVLGRVGLVGRRSRTAPSPPPGPTLIEFGAIVCPFAIVDAGVRVGTHAFLGDRVSLRPGVTIGDDTSIGGATFLGRGVEVGDRVRTQNACMIGPGVVIEAGAFLAATVHAITGRTMSSSPRRPPPVFRRGCQVGCGAMIMPGVEIGEEAVVGASAVVVDDVAPGETVVGIPARPLGSAVG